MEKFITHITTRTVITVLVGFLWLASACQRNCPETSTQNQIPEQVIAKSLEYAFNDKSLSKRMSKGIYIEKNYLVQYIKPFRTGKYNISIIDSTSVNMKDPFRKKNTVFQFLGATKWGNENVIEINYVLSFGLYVNLFLKKKNGSWIVTKSESFYT